MRDALGIFRVSADRFARQVTVFSVLVSVAFAGPQGESDAPVLEVHGDSGFFLSPSYPRKYPSQQNLTYTAHLSTPGPLMLKIYFDVDLEGQSSTCYDYVQIYSTKYCGTATTTREIRINGTEFVMTFYSDQLIEKTGFNVSFYVLQVFPTESPPPAPTTKGEVEATTRTVGTTVPSDSSTSVETTTFTVTPAGTTSSEKVSETSLATESTTRMDSTSEKGTAESSTKIETRDGDSSTQPFTRAFIENQTTNPDQVSVNSTDTERITEGNTITHDMADISTGVDLNTQITTGDGVTAEATSNGQQVSVEETTLAGQVTVSGITGPYTGETTSFAVEGSTTGEEINGETTLDDGATGSTTAGQVLNGTSQNTDEFSTQGHFTEEVTDDQSVNGSTTSDQHPGETTVGYTGVRHTTLSGQSTVAFNENVTSLTSGPQITHSASSSPASPGQTTSIEDTTQLISGQFTEQTSVHYERTDSSVTGQPPASEATTSQDAPESSTREPLAEGTSTEDLFEVSTATLRPEQTTESEDNNADTTVQHLSTGAIATLSITQSDPTQQTMGQDSATDSSTIGHPDVSGFQEVTSSTTADTTHPMNIPVGDRTDVTVTDHSFSTLDPQAGASATSGQTKPDVTSLQTRWSTAGSSRDTTDITPAVTTPPKVLTAPSCRCMVVTKDTRNSTGQFQIESLVNSLTLEKGNLSATRRRYVSVSDPRPSSRLMGAVGILLCALPLLFMIVTDLTGLCVRDPTHVHHRYTNDQCVAPLRMTSV